MSRSIDSYLVKKVKELEKSYDKIEVMNGKVSTYQQLVLDAMEMLENTFYNYEEQRKKWERIFEGEAHDDDEEYDE